VAALTVQVRQRGTITIPRVLRRKYQLGEGDVFTLVDLGEGSLLLKRGQSEVERLGDQVATILAEEGVALDDMLQALDEERERYYREHYLQA